jgi:hypothetical protein
VVTGHQRSVLGAVRRPRSPTRQAFRGAPVAATALVLAALALPGAALAAAGPLVETDLSTATAAVVADGVGTAGEQSPLATTAAADPSSNTLTGPPTEGDRWLLADRLSARMDGNWVKSRGVYGGTGNFSIRMNAMFLELHALAALQGHTGPARQDARIAPLLTFFTTSPVVVRRTLIKRATAQFPHVPAFEAVFTRHTKHASLHPSADAIVMRALAAAWRVRSIVALPAADAARLQDVVGDVARGTFYRSGQRAENQINWNADVAETNYEVNGDKRSLLQYRNQLQWFAEHIREPIGNKKTTATNLSAGYGFHYNPERPASYPTNKYDTVEYANLVHAALGFYGTAVRGGMRPLGPTTLARLQTWSRHIVYGTWTHAGYLNWDTGLGIKRRHLRQYWGFALDSLVRASSPGALTGSTSQRQYVRQIAENGLELYLRSAWDGTGALPGPTQFGAPNGFPEATGNEIMAPLRFALVGANLGDRLADVAPKTPGNMYSHDTGTDRLAISTPKYNTAIVRAGVGPEGGLEPTRLFDGEQRPLTLLGSSGLDGPSPGLKLTRGGGTLLDTQPGTKHSLHASFIGVSGSHRNRSAQFTTMSAGGTVVGAITRAPTGKGKGKGKARPRASVRVSQAFKTGQIKTHYSIRRGTATSTMLRMPIWNQDSEVLAQKGVRASNGNFWRDGSGTIRFKAITPAGGTMTVAFYGVPASAAIHVVNKKPMPRAPSGTRQIEIQFRSTASTQITRTITVQ